MENNKNRLFYKVSDSSDYLKNKNKYIKFISRIPDEDIIKFRTIQGFENLQTCKKGNVTVRDRTKEFDFDVIPYDNSEGKDVVANHSVIITTPEYKQDVWDIITTNFPHAKLKNSGKNSVTTQLYSEVVDRGEWFSYGKEEEIKYPICVLSYKRADKNGKTHLLLTKKKINHYLFIQKSQLEAYESWYNPDYCKLIVGDEWSDEGMGSTTVRNYILNWGKDQGYDRVWMLDDNIKGYKRYYQGGKNEITSNEIFTHIEKYIERYDNVGGVSHNFNPFIAEGDCRACIVTNNKCYSSMLLKTDGEIIFRYKHQEDNLISIEYINKGYCNLCFNSILYDKDTSGMNGGGNREAIYKCKDKDKDGDGYKERYEYFEAILFILSCENKFKLIDGKKPSDFLSRDKRMKSKEYHANCEYKYLKGHDNVITKKPNYDEIVKKQLKSNLVFRPNKDFD